jgi:hypothetical protein
MRVRHRIPSIFSLSMVDVLCCALGCFILLWLVGAKQSADKKQADKAELDKQKQAQANEVSNLEAKLQVATARADALQVRLRTSGKALDVARTDAADLTNKLAEAHGRIDALQAVADTVPGVRDDLKKMRQQYDADETRLQTLNNDLAAKKQDFDETSRKLATAQTNAKKSAADLDDAKGQLKALQATLDDRGNEIAQLRSYKDKFTANEDKLLALTKDLTEARRTADAFQADTVRWRNEVDRVKAEADNRFAGLTLTGKRVVFLVDMSGSMDYVDDNTKAPEKWLGVRTAVQKIMRSLPELEKFQLITFSDKSHYPLGGEGKWFDYDPKTSPDLVFKTLAAITPEGGTNMYVPMQSAFAMRAQGLDTVYLCSDGLPNLGEGVTPEETKTLSEDERGAKLGQFIRNKLKADWNREIPGQSRVHIHTVGFFYESPDVGAFLWALARENDGGFVGMSKP